VVLALPNGAGCVAGAGAASRYLAGLRDDLEVLGCGEGFGPAKVDQWVDFVWHEVEVVVGAVLLPARAGEPPFDAKQVLPSWQKFGWVYFVASGLFLKRTGCVA
jgi:hypothetical protein